MGALNHTLCPDCYQELEPGRTPHVVVGDDDDEPIVCCCVCGDIADPPIPYRHELTDAFECEGVHHDDDAA
jgi:RNase P subunit RPR2